jgi:integrase
LGLRWGEAAGVTVDRLDLLSGAIRVDRQLTRAGVLADTKSASSERRLSLSPDLVEDLAALLARRGLSAADGPALLFVNGDGTELDYTNWRRRTWAPACEKARLARLRFHDLRSTATSALVAEGVDVKTAQQRLGHSSARVTLDIYARSTDEADREAALLVAARLRPRNGRGIGTSAKRKVRALQAT